MVAEWKLRSLGDITENFDAMRMPVKKTERRTGPYPYYGASGVVDYVDNYIFDGEYLLVAEDGENLRTRKTPIAFLARGKFWVNNHAHIIRGGKKADTRYLMYALSQIDISGFLTGSTIPKLTQRSLNRIPIPTPPLFEQEAIATTLGVLDDKTELNHRLNETLEAMARALFKSWFIDFDPVHAKMEGRDTGLAPEIAILFPDRFDSDGLPQGWEQVHLGQVFELSPRTPVIANGPLPYIDMAALPTDSARVKSVSSREPTSGARFTNGDALLARITPCLENGKACYVDFLETGEVGLGSTEFIVFRPKNRLSGIWAYLMLRDTAFRSHAIANMSGTSGRQRVSADSLSSWPVSLAPEPICLAFESIVAPIFKDLKVRDQESRTLASLRDLLLPRLMSGEIRIEDAQRLVGDART